MLRLDPFDRLVAARLLDFFGAETAWQRRLWDVGSCLTLQEIVEAADAVVERALSTEALGWLKASALPSVGQDVGLGSPAERSTLTAALKGSIAQGSFDARVVRLISESASRHYLMRWAQAIEHHIQRAMRRLYRVRNLVLHNAATDSLTLAPAARAAAPLLGAGIDRVVRGALLQEIEPLDLAVRARIVIDNADDLRAGDLADLLQLADDDG